MFVQIGHEIVDILRPSTIQILQIPSNIIVAIAATGMYRLLVILAPKGKAQPLIVSSGSRQR
jgi:hypothetical protein